MIPPLVGCLSSFSRNNQSSTISPIATHNLSTEADSTADEIEDVLTYYNEDEEPPEPAEYEEPEEPYKDPLDDLILTVTYTDTTGKERTYTSLPPNPTIEQLKQATVAIKPQCVALSSGYSCGIHDNPAAPIGAEYLPKAGDELAMGSTMMEVVKIDGSGNGMGIATVKAFNNAKFGVEFKGIKVREGGCIYAGEAITKSLDFALLSRTQREELAKYYAAYNTLLTAADSLAPEIAKGMNTLLDALKSKKAATRALLEENDLTKLPDILINCTDIATQSQATQDSLQKLYCGLQAGTIKGYKKDDIKAALDANIEFMNKLGPALADCQSTSFTPWVEKPCGGPCAFEFESYVVDEECMKSLKPVFGVSDQSMAAELLLNIKPSEDPISEAQLRDALLFGTTFKTAAATINGEVVEYEYNVWNSINVIKYKGETYWYADNEYYTLGTCVQNSDPNTARPAFKKCINPKPNNTCSYECIDMELGTSIGVQAADMIAKTFTKSLELMLIAYTAPTTTLAAAEGSLDLFAKYLLNEKPEWAMGTTAVVIGLNVYLASKGKPKITNETQEALIKSLEKSGTSLYFKNLGNKFTDYWVQAYSAAKKKVGRWRVNGVGNLDDLVSWASKNGLSNLTRTELDDIFKFVDNNFDFAKRVANSTKEIQSATTLTELAGKLNLPITPAAKSLTPYQTRVWYSWRKAKISDMIDKTQTLENQAKQAVNMRNEIRSSARQAMKDSDIADYLDAKELNKTGNNLCKKKLTKDLVAILFMKR